MDKITFSVNNTGEVIFLAFKRGHFGIIILGVIFSLLFIIIIANYYIIAADPDYAAAAAEQQKITINAGAAEGNIYDRNMKPLVNADTEYIAVVVPQAVDKEAAASIAADKEEFYEKYKKGQPFTMKCTDYAEESEGLTIFQIPVRYSDDQTAQHIIGYTSDGKLSLIHI